MFNFTGGTPSIGTGPSSAAVGTGYIHAETSGQYGKIFDLEKTFPAGSELYGVAFQYHMYGSTVGFAVLETSADGTSWDWLWSKSGDLGNQWLQATVYAGSGQTMVRYTYTSGTSYTGDFALDDIRIGDCLTVGCNDASNAPCIDPSGCDSATGMCSFKADGTTCDDNDSSTVNDVCTSGICLGGVQQQPSASPSLSPTAAPTYSGAPSHLHHPPASAPPTTQKTQRHKIRSPIAMSARMRAHPRTNTPTIPKSG